VRTELGHYLGPLLPVRAGGVIGRNAIFPIQIRMNNASQYAFLRSG